MIIEAVALTFICSLANRARGSQFWNTIPSTILCRVFATFIIGSTVTGCTEDIIILPIVWAGLMLWCTPAWDSYWSAQIGNGPQSKLWGCAMMFLRQLLILPTFGATAYLTHGNYWYCALAGVLWLPYLIFGFFNKAYAIARAEYAIGAIIGLTLALIIGVTL